MAVLLGVAVLGMLEHCLEVVVAVLLGGAVLEVGVEMEMVEMEVAVAVEDEIGMDTAASARGCLAALAMRPLLTFGLKCFVIEGVT